MTDLIVIFKKCMTEKFSFMIAEKIVKILVKFLKMKTMDIGKRLKRELIDISILEALTHLNYQIHLLLVKKKLKLELLEVQKEEIDLN